VRGIRDGEGRRGRAESEKERMMRGNSGKRQGGEEEGGG